MRKIAPLTAFAVLLAVGSLPAQEDNTPPPRRGTPERRAQRGERLRKLAGSEGALGQLLDSLAGNAAGNMPALDIPKVNEGIIELIKPLLDDERGLESLRLRFDPAETNFARDTVHLVGAARLRRSGWSDEPTQVDLDLRASMQRRDDGRPKGTLDGELRFQTDVVALANKAMQRFANQLDRRAQQGAVRDGPLSAEETFRLRMREKLAATPPLKDMDDVIDLILSFSGLRLTAINDRVAELKAQVDSAPDEKTRASLEKQLAEARRQRDQMLELRPEVERDGGQQAAALRLSMDRSQVDETTRVERLNVEITKAQVTLRLVGSTLQGMELYGVFKPLLMNTLSRVQSRDADTFQLGRGMFRGYMKELRGALDDEGGETLPPPATDAAPPATGAAPPATGAAPPAAPRVRTPAKK
ncbi:MAG TPA: hypothetical protein VFI31_20515 [Pirellulales bacterium]|nr:hypothetical protein [Pirellulales bacterium]